MPLLVSGFQAGFVSSCVISKKGLPAMISSKLWVDPKTQSPCSGEPVLPMTARRWCPNSRTGTRSSTSNSST